MTIKLISTPKERYTWTVIPIEVIAPIVVRSRHALLEDPTCYCVSEAEDYKSYGYDRCTNCRLVRSLEFLKYEQGYPIEVPQLTKENEEGEWTLPGFKDVFKKLTTFWKKAA